MALRARIALMVLFVLLAAAAVAVGLVRGDDHAGADRDGTSTTVYTAYVEEPPGR